MKERDIKTHIRIKKCDKEELLWWLEVVENLNKEVGLSNSTYDECRTKISSKIAQCDISIRDHEKLLT